MLIPFLLFYKAILKKIKKIKYYKYLKLIFRFDLVLTIIISAIISNTYTIILNEQYNKFYKKSPDLIEAKAIVIKGYEEKEYSYVYEIKIKTGEYKNKKFLLTANKKPENIFEYGDILNIKGEYILPNESRNYKGFNYREYLKTKKIYGTIKARNNDLKVIGKDGTNPILKLSNKIRNSMNKQIESLLPSANANLLEGILIGDKNQIPEDIIEDFKISSLSHVLSVSGANTAYIIIGATYILTKSKISKKSVYIITIVLLVIFMAITNFTSSVIRAVLMAIVMLGSKLFYRKVDILTSIALSLAIMLIYNPFMINDIGLQLSYLGTLGIVLLNKNIEILLCRLRIPEKISKILSVIIAAQIMIMPIMALNFNNVSLIFFVSNVLVSPLIGTAMILGFITIFISYIFFSLAKILAYPLELILNLIVIIAHITAKIPFSSITIITPYIFTVILVYLSILTSNYIYSIYISKEKSRKFQKDLLKLINFNNIKKVLGMSLIIILIFNSIDNLYNSSLKNLRIYFIDVGQGDSTLIITPSQKTILIDGGEGKTDTLLPYLLDRRIKKIDYIIISHFDSDHCNGLIEVIKNLNVKNIIISKQAYILEEYINIANIINEKRINTVFVKQGDKLNISKNITIDILYPPNKLEYEDLNNNSIVAKLSYNNFSILFTGDIGESEKNIIEKYKDMETLKSNILKISHHGSKTSSTESFLNEVKPQIALIGVGENNKFGHPSSSVLKRLEGLRSRSLQNRYNGRNTNSCKYKRENMA